MRHLQCHLDKNKSVVLSLNVVFFQSYHIENRGFGLVAIEEQQCMAWQSYQIFNDASFPVSFGLIPDDHHHHVHYGPLSPRKMKLDRLDPLTL